MPRGERGSSKPFLRGDIWWIRYTVPGEEKERRESSKSTNKVDALRLLHQRLKQIDDGQIAPGKATIHNLLELFLADQERQGRKSPRTARGYVRIHLEPAFGKVPVEAFATRMLNDFVQKEKKAGKANASINRWLAALRRGFKLGRLAQPPLVYVEPHIAMLKENNVREGYLSEEAYLRMRELLPFHQQLLLVMGLPLGHA